MNYVKYLPGALLIISMASCSKKELDNINRDLNYPDNVLAASELPSVEVETAAGTTATDIAWYASVFIEHSAGCNGQLRSADNRTAATAASLFNNSWNTVYENLMILKDIINKCSPGGPEPGNKNILGIAQVLTAYNLAVATDVWGQVPWTEALQGQKLPQPKYDKQEHIYKNVLFKYLNEAIDNLSSAAGEKALLKKNDLIYGGDILLWTKAAWSLKARYFMRMQNVVPSAVDSALACISKGFSGAGDAFVFKRYEATSIGENPWYQLLYSRGYLVTGQTLYDLMKSREDPRIAAYFVDFDGVVYPAPPGQAKQSWSGENYSYSRITDNGQKAATPLMTYHELKFIEAEALARKGLPFTAVLEEAIKASFGYHDVDYPPSYFSAKVLPYLGASTDSYLKEIMTQKYIAMYEFESIEAYNDYRRTKLVELHNPGNMSTNFGFVERYAYPSSEVTSNPSNIPKVNVYKDKVWWAGGTE